MASIADFFFIAGLEDDYEFEFTQDSVEESVSKQTQSVRFSRLLADQSDSDSVASTARRMQSHNLEGQHVDGTMVSSDEESSLPEPSFQENRKRSDLLGKASILHAVDEVFSDFRTDSFDLGSIVDPVKRSRKEHNSGSQPVIVPTQHHQSHAVGQSEDQFDVSIGRRFTRSRRDRSGLVRRLSTSRARRPESRQSIAMLRSDVRRMSQAYSHVAPDPEPLILPPGTHPLKTVFPPRLLARYPETSSAAFPQFLPMFAFPNDISIVLADNRPAAIWHGFSLTRETGELIHGVCIILYIPLPRMTASKIERRCAAWRQANMQLEQREMSTTLARKLATEKASLSSLLLKLSQASVGSRDSVSDHITECEERIALYTDLLRPVRHGAQANIEGLTASDGMWMPRALGVLSSDAHQQGVLKCWLQAIAASYLHTELLNVPALSQQPLLPLERYVVNICAEVPKLPAGKTKIELSVRNARIQVLKEASNEVPGCRTIDLYPLFRALSLQNIVLMWEAAMMESRIILTSKHSSMMSAAASALVNLLYPFKWRGIYIPILPRRLIAYLDAPTPYIMGIDKQIANVDIPTGEDLVFCDLDDNVVRHSSTTKLPDTTRSKLMRLLHISCPMHSQQYRVPYGTPPYCQEAYPFKSVAVRSTINDCGQPLVELLTQNSSDFGITASLSPSIPNLNLFLERNTSDQASQLFPEYRRPRSEIHQHRPTFSHSLSSYTTKMRVPDFRKNRASWQNTVRNPALGSLKGESRTRHHVASPSMSSLAETSSIYSQAYALSTAATSCIQFDEISSQGSNRDSDVVYSEGHRMRSNATANTLRSPIYCDYTSEQINGDFFVCSTCNLTIQEKYVQCISIPCLPATLDSNKARASFIRCSSSLLYNYRRYIVARIGNQSSFDRVGYERDCVAKGNHFLQQVLQTQAFASFIDDRCVKDALDPEVCLFDDILLAKRNRGKDGLFNKTNRPTFLLSQVDAPKKTFTAIKPNAEHARLQVPKSGAMEVPVPDFLDDKSMSVPRIFTGSLG